MVSRSIVYDSTIRRCATRLPLPLLREQHLGERDQHALRRRREPRGHADFQAIDESGCARIVSAAIEFGGERREDRGARERRPAGAECLGVAVLRELLPDAVLALENIQFLGTEIAEASCGSNGARKSARLRATVGMVLAMDGE